MPYSPWGRKELIMTEAIYSTVLSLNLHCGKAHLPLPISLHTHLCIFMSLWGKEVFLPVGHNIDQKGWERGTVCLTLLYPPESA